MKNANLIIILLLVLFTRAAAQCPPAAAFYNREAAIEDYVNNVSDPDINLLQTQLAKLNGLKKQFEKCKLPHDSVYARILHRMGDYEYRINHRIATANAISYTLEAASINTSASKGACKKFAVKNYLNLGIYFKSIGFYNKAINCLDSLVILNKAYPDQYPLTLRATQEKLDAYFNSGDYQKYAEVCSFLINTAKSSDDTAGIFAYCNQRAQAFLYQNKTVKASADVDSALHYLSLHTDDFELATSLKLKAMLAAKSHAYTTADHFFTNALKQRKTTLDAEQISKDYIDYGNFYLNELNNYTKARELYFKAVDYALKAKNNIVAAQVYLNLGQADFRYHQLQEAEHNYASASALLNVKAPDDFLKNASATQLLLVYNKDLLIVFLNNKTELLLHLYKEKKDEKYLTATLQTAFLTDSVITQLRHEQIGEQSKLYWRNKTRELFINALEACYVANNAAKAFYFMEKSRAVLLSDKLNELGALAHVPGKVAAQEESLQVKIVEEQQKLLSLPPSSKAYSELQSEIYRQKDKLEKLIQSLEQKYPAYYQYKYADSVPGLQALQRYLAKDQSFVHYFMNDTVMYVLGITPGRTIFKKWVAKDFDCRQLSGFISLCSDVEKLDSSYRSFAYLAQNIYRRLFEPLHLPAGNVAICTDNFLIPFEALCTDADGKDFLLYHYKISYVYSARTFIKPFINNVAPAGNFIGFAPVSFMQHLQLVPLIQSADSLSKAAEFYSNHTVYTQKKASRYNFFSNADKYAVVNIFSHAQADTSDREPLLYMQDSAIYLSELLYLQKPATQFVLLSACQTNTGKTANGEGIYSLARGFAAAGIPSVAGTLWKADDKTIYSISAKFNEYLAAGNDKSEALQKAKIWFIQNHPNDEYRLPYFWANMVLIGNTQPISLVKENSYWIWITAVLLGVAAIVTILLVLKYNNRHLKQKTAPTAHLDEPLTFY